MAEVKGVSAKVVTMGILLGIVISFIGTVIIAGTTLLEKEPTEEAIASARGVNRNALVVWSVGALILTISMFLGALYCAEIPAEAKLGLLIAIALIGMASIWFVTQIGALIRAY